MELSPVLDPRRWRQRFKSEADVRAETIAAGQAPDATVDEVGSAPAPEGFEGTALPGHHGRGYGPGDPRGAGWGGGARGGRGWPGGAGPARSAGAAGAGGRGASGVRGGRRSTPARA